MSLSADLLGEEGRRDIVDFYSTVFGWQELPTETVDRKKRFAIEHEMMALEYKNGGYIIWGFSNFLDGYSSKVQGLIQGWKGVMQLNNFGNGYRTFWFA